MSDTTAGNSRMLKDTVLYMIAKAIEGIVGIVTISRLSYMFLDEEIGRYTNWNIIATTSAMLAIQWLSQSASRYLNEYELKGDQRTFYSTVFSGWLKVNIAGVFVWALFAAALAAAESGGVPRFLEFVYRDGFITMFALAITYFMTYNTSQMLIALLSVKRKVYVNLMISVFSSTGKLLLIVCFSKVFGAKIGIIFLSYIVCDFFVILLALVTLSAIKYIKAKSRSRELSRALGRYGAPLVGNLATTTVLNNSDRFIITQFAGEGSNGVYSQNYSVVSAAFTMLQTALMRGAYPTILKTYAEGKTEQTELLISQAVRNYLIVAVPAVAGVGVLARPLAELVFSERFARGYPVMVWVALGLMFLGLTEYSNKPWELSAKTWYIFRNSLIGGIANITLNIVFMPRFGYMTAAYSTFAGFFIYFCLSKLGSRKLMRWRLTVRTYASIIGSALVMACGLLAAISLTGVTRLTLFAYIFLGVIVYGVSLVIAGEVNDEIRMAKGFLNERKSRRETGN